jgi:alpha-D-ribose 1-methylphosphonate 5-triphosphate diphosphatase PhnM
MRCAAVHKSLAIPLAGLTLCWVAVDLFSTSATAHELRIEHVTIVSAERSTSMRDADVSIKDDRIVAITRGNLPAEGSNKAEIIDGTGLYLTPGLIDSHVHSSDLPGISGAQPHANADIVRAMREQVPRSYLFFGYTTLIDLIAVREQVTAWNAQSQNGLAADDTSAVWTAGSVRPDLSFRREDRQGCASERG